jgi:hypothetical protein
MVSHVFNLMFEIHFTVTLFSLCLNLVISVNLACESAQLWRILELDACERAHIRAAHPSLLLASSTTTSTIHHSPSTYHHHHTCSPTCHTSHNTTTPNAQHQSTNHPTLGASTTTTTTSTSIAPSTLQHPRFLCRTRCRHASTAAHRTTTTSI